MKLSVAGIALCATASLGIVAASAPAVSAGSTQVSTVSQTALARTALVKKTVRLSQKQRAALAVKFAYAHIGDRYRYGGNGPHQWDCSGLVGGAWRHGGVKLPRVTSAIYRKVRKKVRWSDLRQGDLVFFYHLGHVGIYVNGGYMIHSPRSGQRVNRVKLSRYYRQQFSGAVRPGA